MPPPRALIFTWLGPPCLRWVGAPGRPLTSLLTGISWDGFRGARVIAFPGTTAYARNHGIYLTDAQVVPLGPWARAAEPGWAGLASWPCALGGLSPWTRWYSLDSEKFPLWQQPSGSMGLSPNGPCTWPLGPGSVLGGAGKTCRALSGGTVLPAQHAGTFRHAPGFFPENGLAVSLTLMVLGPLP